MYERHLHSAPSSGGRSSEYSTWSSMRQRCYNSNDRAYHRYGGRGIKVCERWNDSYTAFLADMGMKPTPEHTLERVDNDGNYEPGNVVWALPAVQSRNKRSNHNVTALGETKCITDWASALGASPSTVAMRLKAGKSAEDAVSLPPRVRPRTCVTCRGKTMTVHAWASETGTPASTLIHRLASGWSTEDALFSPPGAKGTGRKRSVMLTIDGVTRSLPDWVSTSGTKRSTIEMRLRNGWVPEEAVFGRRAKKR